MGVQRVVKEFFKGISRVLLWVFFLGFRGVCINGFLMNVLRVCPVSRLFIRIFSRYSRVFGCCFRGVFRVCFEGVSRLSQCFFRDVLR